MLRVIPGTGRQREEASANMSEGGTCSMVQATSTGSLFRVMLTIVLSGYWATQKVPGGDADGSSSSMGWWARALNHR